jgi:hypothetical protein
VQDEDRNSLWALSVKVPAEGNKKDLGTRLKPSLTGWSLRVTVSVCDLDLPHSCPSASCGLLVQSRALGYYTKPDLLCQAIWLFFQSNFAVITTLVLALVRSFIFLVAQ